MTIDNEPLTNAELAILEMAGYTPAGGGNIAGDGVIILRFRKKGGLFEDTRGGWRLAIADQKRLIASAPELLEACVEAHRALMETYTPEEATPMHEHLLPLLRAAIEKARCGE